MIEKIYKTRKEAEEIRQTGESIYFVSDVGYYIIPSKKKDNHLHFMFGVLFGWLLGVFLGYLLWGTIN